MKLVVAVSRALKMVKANTRVKVKMAKTANSAVAKLVVRRKMAVVNKASKILQTTKLKIVRSAVRRQRRSQPQSSLTPRLSNLVLSLIRADTNRRRHTVSI